MKIILVVFGCISMLLGVLAVYKAPQHQETRVEFMKRTMGGVTHTAPLMIAPTRKRIGADAEGVVISPAYYSIGGTPPGWAGATAKEVMLGKGDELLINTADTKHMLLDWQVNGESILSVDANLILYGAGGSKIGQVTAEDVVNLMTFGRP